MKASALNKIGSYDREEHSIVQVSQKIRLDYAEQYDDDTGGITLGEEASYGRVKEPMIRNIIAKFNGDCESFEQAQILLESRLKNHARAKFGSIIHRYCGMIKCTESGASLIAKKRTVAGH